MVVKHYLESWRSSSLIDFEPFISKAYKAREITSEGQVIDFGYAESIKGWEQGFHFVKKNEAEWLLNELATLTLREDEIMVILSAGMAIKGHPLATSNLFFHTFKRTDGHNWLLVRSYIEAGINTKNLSDIKGTPVP
jgi:hypothetical protein